jgi:hypothetical protein
MAGVLPVQRNELERVAQANTEVVEIAKNLVSLAAKTPDPDTAKELYAQIERLLGSSQEISVAMQAAIANKATK